MKRNILILSTVLIVLSLTAYVVSSSKVSETIQKETASSEPVAIGKQLVQDFNLSGYPDFVYDVDSRFIANITKEKLHKVTSLLDFLPKEQTDKVFRYKSVSVEIIENDMQIFKKNELGDNEVLTPAQLKLLRSTDYSTNFFILARFQEKNEVNGDLIDSYFSPHFTVIPENEAVYENGKEALIAYLKENSIEKTTIVDKYTLKPGKIFFTVTKKGTISNVNLTSTSGYPSIDLHMLEVVKSIPGVWEAATNEKGEKVDQELVFSFGLMGC